MESPWGLKSSFYLQNCHRIKSDKFTKCLLQAAPVVAWALTCSSCPQGGRVCFATLPRQPCAFLLPRVMRAARGVGDKAETWLFSGSRADARLSFVCSAGRLLINLTVDQPWVWMDLNGFNEVKCPVMSQKRDRLLPGVGLDDLMGYLLSVSQL